MANFIFYISPTLAVACTPSAALALHSLDGAARATGVHPEMLRYYCRLGLLGADLAEANGEPTFDREALCEVRRIEHYRRHLGVPRRALPLICHLRREGERLQIELRFLGSP